jgi:hypothetical protein
MRHRLVFLALAAIASLAGGCAGSVPKPTFIEALPRTSQIAKSDDEKVKIAEANGVAILESEKARLAERIIQKVDSRKALNGRDGEAKTYEVDLLLTRYDKGSAFARAMLAGLGQIHIEAEVTLIELPAHMEVGRFAIKKTFAWGGIYGATTSMEDIEESFAEGIAEALTGGQADQKQDGR